MFRKNQKRNSVLIFTLLFLLSACSPPGFKAETGYSDLLRPENELLRTGSVTEANYLNGKAFCAKFAEAPARQNGRYIPVPIDEANPEKGTIEIFVWSAQPFDPAKPSVITVDGGPGQNSHVIKGIDLTLGNLNELHFDQRGVGCSAPETFSQYQNTSLYGSEQTVKDLESIRKAYQISTWAIYGISYGTIVATKYASRYPSQTRATVLEGTVYSKEFIHNSEFKNSIAESAVGMMSEEAQNKLREVIKTKEGQEFIASILMGLLSMNDPELTASYNLENLLLSDRLDTLIQEGPVKDESPQNPSAMDRLVHRVISCTEDIGLIGDCPADLTKQTFVASQFPVSVPVYYLQGQDDIATNAPGAYYHFQEVPQGRAYFLEKRHGGHNPLLMSVRAGETNEIAIAKGLYIKAFLAQELSDADMASINAAAEFPVESAWTFELNQ